MKKKGFSLPFDFLTTRDVPGMNSFEDIQQQFVHYKHFPTLFVYNRTNIHWNTLIMRIVRCHRTQYYTVGLFVAWACLLAGHNVAVAPLYRVFTEWWAHTAFQINETITRPITRYAVIPRVNEISCRFRFRVYTFSRSRARVYFSTYGFLCVYWNSTKQAGVVAKIVLVSPN